MGEMGRDYNALLKGDLSLEQFVGKYARYHIKPSRRLPQGRFKVYDCGSHAERVLDKMFGKGRWAFGGEIPWSKAKPGDWVSWGRFHHGIVLDPARRIVESCWGVDGIVFEHDAEVPMFPQKPTVEEILSRATSRVARRWVARQLRLARYTQDVRAVHRRLKELGREVSKFKFDWNKGMVLPPTDVLHAHWARRQEMEDLIKLLPENERPPYQKILDRETRWTFKGKIRRFLDKLGANDATLWTVYLFSDTGKVLWKTDYMAVEEEAEAKALGLVKPYLDRYDNAEDWVFEPAASEGATP